MFCPPSILTAAYRTTALPTVQVPNVLNASRGARPAARADRHCQPPETIEATIHTGMPSAGGIVIVSRTGSIYKALAGLGFLTKSISANNITRPSVIPLSATLNVGQCSDGR